MNTKEIIKDISKRGNGSIYLGVVGAVRTGKSTFIKKVIENLVVPYVDDEYLKKQCLDEIPQSSSGKQIMTCEPKFVPSNGATIKIDEITTNIKLIDCVGFVIDNSIGYVDNDGKPRLVHTPWYSEAIPFTEAAEIGTEKVIRDHSTIGIVITSDGSFGEFKREDYLFAEEKVISELKTINKPFIVILNTTKPDKALDVALSIKNKYNVEVLPMDIMNMNKKDINNILKLALDEFSIDNLNINIPEWVHVLPSNNEIKKHYLSKMKESMINVNKVKDINNIIGYYTDSSYINRAYISNLDIGSSTVTLNLESSDELYQETLKEIMGDMKVNKASVLKIFSLYRDSKEETDTLKDAIKCVNKSGYGIVYPTIKNMKLETPEVIKQGSRYGVKLKAKATSIHMIKVDVETTFAPIIGSEENVNDLIKYIMKDYKTNPDSIWKCEIFGRSLENIVKDGINVKLNMMNENTKYKMNKALTKVINKGTDKLIAIVI